MRTTMNKLLRAVIVLMAAPALASTQIPAKPQDHPIALIGGTIHSVSGSDYAGGTIVFDKGKIIGLGMNVAVPADAEKIDVTGK